MSLQSGTGRRPVCLEHSEHRVSSKRWAWKAASTDAKKIQLGNLRNGGLTRPQTKVD